MIGRQRGRHYSGDRALALVKLDGLTRQVRRVKEVGQIRLDTAYEHHIGKKRDEVLDDGGPRHPVEMALAI